MFGKLLLAAAAMAAIACAKPNYASGGKQTGPTQQKIDGGIFSASGKRVSYSWEAKPTDSDFGSFYFRTYSEDSRDGFPVLEDVPVSVVLWMPSMGHGSSPVTVERLGVGTYRASKVFFTMRGDWQIRFQLKDGATVNDEAILPFSF